MNQILNFVNTSYKSKKKSKLFYKFLLFISLFIILASIIFLFNYIKTLIYNDKNATRIADSFSVLQLYSNNSGYLANSTGALLNSSNLQPFVVGVIKIEKLKINYPILSEVSDELLKIAPCRFAGPLPNEIRKCMYCWT